MSTAAAMSDPQPDNDPVAEDPRVLRSLERQRRHLQIVVAIVALGPVVAGLYGVVFGAALTGDRLGLSGDSHYRFLSGLYRGIGLLFWSPIPNIGAVGPRFRPLPLLVVTGGFPRLAGTGVTDTPPLHVLAALAGELAVAPILCFWQWRIARGYLVQEEKPAPRRKAPPPAPPPSPETPPAEARPAAPAHRPGPLVAPDDIPEPVPAPPPRAASGPAEPSPEPAPSLPQAPGRTP